MAAPTEVTEPRHVLSERQLARVECMKAARSVLVERGFASAGKADPIDLVNLAMYIESGQDPYELDPVREIVDRIYPHHSGDVTVLGPEVIVDQDRTVISYQGENYYRPTYPPCSTSEGWGECVLADGHDDRESEHRTESDESVPVQWEHIDRYGHHWGVKHRPNL